MRRLTALLSAALLAACSTTAAPPAPVAPPRFRQPDQPPRLVIAISVDQLSADLFDEYRPHFTGGFARLAGGTVFRNGYQAHASTETCPGHSTILTGRNPSATGIIANGWIDQSVVRDDKIVNCAEDERVPGSNSRSYTVSPLHLRVPTLGEMLRGASVGSKVVAVAGKDRSAVMMTGRGADQRWYWGTKDYVTDLKGAAVPASVAAANQAVARMIAAPQPALDPPAMCAAKAKRYQAGDQTVGDGRFARKGGDPWEFRNSPAFDGATLALAAALTQEMQLGRDDAPDLLAVGLSGTDVVGHAYGNGGQEMCLQLLSLDRDLGDFFLTLDRSGVDYAVVLTADHGGMDLAERLRDRGVPGAARADVSLGADTMGKAIARQLGLNDPVLHGDASGAGEMWLERRLRAADRDRVLAAAIAAYRAHPQVAAVFTAEEVRRTALPAGAPDQWTLVQRVRASFDPSRSGDFTVVLKEHVAPIPRPSRGYVAGHGTPWDYDRRVPIIFWRPGAPATISDPAVATVDIAPTLAAMLGLSVPAGTMDGKCLSGIPGVTCR